MLTFSSSLHVQDYKVLSSSVDCIRKEVRSLTRHLLMCSGETERIKNLNGRIFALEEEPEVFRIWMPDEDCPGLAMARAFGDFCLKDYGLISIPEVSFRRLTKNDEFVVLATDGVSKRKENQAHKLGSI